MALPVERTVSWRTWKAFACWTALFWGGTVVFAVLFFVGALDFSTSTKLSLYGTSIWLNAWVLPLLLPKAGGRPKSELQHECLVLWQVSYVMTNLLWEIPWLLLSPHVFHNLNTLDDLVAKTPWMRANGFHMYFWVLSSFGSIDLRAVNHNATFYTLELFAFFNIAATIYFARLNRRRSPLRYLVPILEGGEAVAATLIFSLSEVFAGYPDMTGGVADTLLALVWTQYQYVVFPLVFQYVAYQLLCEDWRELGRQCGATGLLEAAELNA